MPDGLADLCTLLGSASLTNLEVVGFVSTAEAGAWARLFQAFPSLVSLEAGADGALFYGLYQASVASPAGESVACRGLERIMIVDYEVGWWRLEQVLDPLVYCLHYRSERGTRLKEFYWEVDLRNDDNRDVTQGYLPCLEELVSMVRIGGICNFAPSDDEWILDEESEESQDGSNGSDDEE